MTGTVLPHWRTESRLYRKRFRIPPNLRILSPPEAVKRQVRARNLATWPTNYIPFSLREKRSPRRTRVLPLSCMGERKPAPRLLDYHGKGIDSRSAGRPRGRLGK